MCVEKWVTEGPTYVRTPWLSPAAFQVSLCHEHYGVLPCFATTLQCWVTGKWVTDSSVSEFSCDPSGLKAPFLVPEAEIEADLFSSQKNSCGHRRELKRASAPPV